DVEMTMELQTYMQTAVCKEFTEVLVLEYKHYERLFTRRHPRTIEAMRDDIGVRLASRLFLLHSSQDVPFLR
ncbi:cAMP-dependent protein kinase regulatory subunit, partial [Biomphalaria glabrata]